MEEKNSVMILIFLLGGEKFGIEISGVIEVNRLPKILPIHSTDNSLIGLINFHGESVPVVALDRFLNLASNGIEKNGIEKKIFIALRTKKNPICFLVDGLAGFEKIMEEEIKKDRDAPSMPRVDYLKFVWVRSDVMIPVLDLNFLTEITVEKG